MPRSGVPCALPENHTGRCRSPEGALVHQALKEGNRLQRILRHQAFVDAYKLERGCLDCGYAEHAVALDLDHRDPSVKLADVSALLSSSTERLMAELAKCDVRCAVCHRVKTYAAQRRKPRPPTQSTSGATRDSDHLPG